MTTHQHSPMRTAFLCLTALAALGLAACNGSDSDPGNVEPTTSESPASAPATDTPAAGGMNFCEFVTAEDLSAALGATYSASFDDVVDACNYTQADVRATSVNLSAADLAPGSGDIAMSKVGTEGALEAFGSGTTTTTDLTLGDASYCSVNGGYAQGVVFINDVAITAFVATPDGETVAGDTCATALDLAINSLP